MKKVRGLKKVVDPILTILSLEHSCKLIILIYTKFIPMKTPNPLGHLGLQKPVLYCAIHDPSKHGKNHFIGKKRISFS